MIPAAFLQELLTRVDIVDVVGRHVELRRAGINHKGLCPFHGEKTPSFIVSPSRQTYHCFGCGVHGDAIRFLTEHVGLSFPDAVRDLAQQVGLAVPEEDVDPAQRVRAAQAREHQATLGERLAQAAAHYRAQLKDSPAAIDYLKGRGLSGQIAARFGLGYAPAGWRSLASAFARYDDPLLVEAGLVIVQGDEGPEQKRYDRFRDRIMFPIRSVRGDVIGFGGRVLDGGEPKYLNSPETPVFSKGRELYGLFEARQAIRAAGQVLVVEGYMDVVALAQHGVGHAVATLGTACTADHVQALFRHADRVVFAFDGDAAGRRAAARALEAALPLATDLRSVRFLFLPPEHDPDSFIRANGREAFEAAVEQAVPLSRQLIEQAADGLDLGSAEGRSRLLAQARPLWSALPDGILRTQVLADLATRSRIDADDLARRWGAAAAPIPRRRPTAARRAVPAAVGLLDRAAWLMLRHPALWLNLSAADHERLIEQPAPYAGLFGAMDRQLHEHGAGHPEHLLAALQADEGTEPALVERIRALHQFDSDDEPPERQLQALLAALELRAVNDELELLMESGELSEAAQTRGRELLERRGELTRRRPAGSAPAAPR